MAGIPTYMPRFARKLAGYLGIHAKTAEKPAENGGFKWKYIISFDTMLKYSAQRFCA